MTDTEGKSKRLRERIRLSLPARVTCRETADHEWVEMTRLIDVTPFGASFPLTRPTEEGRLLHLVLPMPRQLRCFDHAEDQYRVWALVRRVSFAARPGRAPSYEVGTGFVGKYPPASYRADPATRYEVTALSPESNMWTLRERPADDATQEGRDRRSSETRLRLAMPVVVEVLDEKGGVGQREQTITENISRRGASVLTTLRVGRGRFVRLTSAESGMGLAAVVRAARTGPDQIPRLHLEFVNGRWPLEGLE
ncbi:MAG TPA: hypothetical protein VEY09_12630 [Pyrinomonadaceae bacterium]|nr:hypothetical protein [Pyrinomonadaceae bacterium]